MSPAPRQRRSKRLYEKRRYRRDPEFRERKKAANLAYQAREIAANPEHKALRVLRAKISKCHSQIENHERAIEAKRKRIEQINALVVKLTAKREEMLRRRELRRKGLL